MDVINAVKSSALNVAEYFTPVLKESRFKETGVLTPEEFVAAGDHLVHHCPTWYWSKGDESKIKPYLPKDKQLLMTKNVPCYRRFKQIDCMISEEKLIGGDDVDSGWVDTHFYSPETAADKIKEMTLENKPSKSATKNNDSEDEGEAIDMETFLEEGIIEENDPNEAKPDPNEATGDEIVRTRTYDLNITYDKYYQTPRMWLFGYTEKGKPLKVEQMYEDFSADHTKKTITMENHPHLPGPPMASIHPCRHAEVMKRLLEQLAENGKELHVYQYLIVFLKFLQAVIPTIEYDFTRNITL